MTTNVGQRIALLAIGIGALAFLVSSGALQSGYAAGGEPKTWLRVDNDGDGDDSDILVGDAVTAYLLTTYNGPGIVTFRGFHAPDCSNGGGIPCETVVDNDGATAPTYAGDIPGACDPCFEYKVTFSPNTFVFGDDHIDATITNGDTVIGGNANGFTEHSFSVIPESPIGIAALVMSAFAALGGFMFLRSRKSLSLPNNL